MCIVQNCNAKKLFNPIKIIHIYVQFILVPLVGVKYISYNADGDFRYQQEFLPELCRALSDYVT